MFSHVSVCQSFCQRGGSGVEGPHVTITQDALRHGTCLPTPDMAPNHPPPTPDMETTPPATNIWNLVQTCSLEDLPSTGTDI